MIFLLRLYVYVRTEGTLEKKDVASNRLNSTLKENKLILYVYFVYMGGGIMGNILNFGIEYNIVMF